MLISKNDILYRKNKKPIVFDFGLNINQTKKPIVILAHGFKGFKDWGHFNKIMEYFIENKFVFLKFNFSHNGGTVNQPIDFDDLEAFGNNNYTKELDDLTAVVDWVCDNEMIPKEELDTNKIYLIGHSRGGGISLIAANEDKRIKKLITWAAVADLINRYPNEILDQWKKEGVLFIPNSRTNQQMPLYYQLAEDTLNNLDRFNIEKSVKQLTIPYLIIHGKDDEVVTVKEAKSIYSWNNNAELCLIEDANHVFGAYHPYTANHFPEHVISVLQKSLLFLKK